MSTFITGLSKFWASWGPWITVSLIPTIIAGLSVSPKTAPEAAWVQKAWNWVKQLLSMLSVATFKDQPGTFQLPLKMGKVLKKGGGPATMLLFFFISSQMNCAWFKSEAKTGGTIAVDCSVSSVKSVVPQLIGTVEAIFSGNAQNMLQQIEALAKQFGSDAVACAAQEVEQKALAKLPVTGGSGSSADTTTLNNARMTIAHYNWSYKE